MSSPGQGGSFTGPTTTTAGIYTLQGGSRGGDGVHGVGGGNGRGGVFVHGPDGKVGLRVEGDLEVTGDTPRTVHVSKCEVAPAECRCIVQAPEPAAPSWRPKDYFGAGVLVGVVVLTALVEAFKRWF